MLSSIVEPDWDWVAERLGAPEELDGSARMFGALVRRREIRDAGSLLRLCLGYGCGLSLREAAVWAGLNGIATMSDVAVLKRLRGSADWLGHLAGQLVAAHAAPTGPSRPLRIVDGSTVRAPGGGLWRLHVAYDPGEQRFTHIELTDGRGAEKLERAPVAAGEIRIGDRCYARPEGLRHLSAHGGDFIVRIGWKSLRLRQSDGSALDLTQLLDEAREGEPVDRIVEVVNGRKRSLPTQPVRLIVIRKTAQAAEHRQKRARRDSQRGGHDIQPQTLRAADYLMLVTSLDEQAYRADRIAALYRLRWQVELAFKRLKSLLDFSRLPARDPELARTWLSAKLLMALLLENLDQDFLDSPP